MESRPGRHLVHSAAVNIKSTKTLTERESIKTFSFELDKENTGSHTPALDTRLFAVSLSPRVFAIVPSKAHINKKPFLFFAEQSSVVGETVQAGWQPAASAECPWRARVD